MVATTDPLTPGEELQREESKLSVISRRAISYGTEFSAGLTVSFVAMSLGAAFGVQSGRGPLPGILSAGFIALITALFGGTYVQCSGPTAPMTAVTVTLMNAVMKDGLVDDQCGADTECKNKFINMCIVLTGIVLCLCAVIRLGKLITFVPKIVISGFMNGIAVLIWWGEATKIYGIGKPAVGGGMLLNTVIMLSTTAIIFGLPILLGKTGKPWLKKLFPATLVAILFVSCVCLPLGIQRVAVGDPISSASDITALFATNFPSNWSGSFILKALPFALNLTMLCYLDTLLTSLVMDQKVDEKYPPAERWAKTQQNKELFGQGIANAFVAFFGGIPGAQATIRSVLMLNEGARCRLAGIFVGVLAIFEMLALQSLVGKIPAAVFSGVLLKVGYDVFDYAPVTTYIRNKLMGKAHPGGSEPIVGHMDMLFILGTTVITILFSLNIAVASFTAAFYLGRVARISIPDMPTADEVKVAGEAADSEKVLA
jgi:SulP family sulfate permease